MVDASLFILAPTEDFDAILFPALGDVIENNIGDSLKGAL
jgi:hypothetical protein